GMVCADVLTASGADGQLPGRIRWKPKYDTGMEFRWEPDRLLVRALGRIGDMAIQFGRRQPAPHYRAAWPQCAALLESQDQRANRVRERAHRGAPDLHHECRRLA